MIKSDFSVLVDVISNIAGMMVLFACIMLWQDVKEDEVHGELAKPIKYPLAYVSNKKSVILAVKNGYLYQMPSQELLDAAMAESADNGAFRNLKISVNGMEAQLTPSARQLGYEFRYKLSAPSDTPVSDKLALHKKLNALMQKYDAKEYYFNMYSWPQDHRAVRLIRDFLTDNGYEVGWSPRIPRPDEPWDVTISLGGYNENFSPLKAQ
ncbi:MAG: hypothetical protein MK193_08065 [Lentisphaeria bacterium]|nr:hypothetical protein [Lentisphaeria bacterium]